MIQENLKPVIRFLTVSSLLFVAWYFFYELVLHPDGRLEMFVVNNSIYSTRFILEALGFDVFIEPRTVGITKTLGVWIGDSCNGVSLFALFTGFILVYPGNVLAKCIFIPLGIVTIHLLNIARIAGLVIVGFYYPDSLHFNHTYSFTFLVYSYIFILWMIWVKNFSSFSVRNVFEKLEGNEK